MSETVALRRGGDDSTTSVYAIGIGFRHACPVEEMHVLIEKGLATLQLQPDDIICVSTSSHKADAPLVSDIARHYGWTPRFFSRKKLAEFSERKVAYLSHHSPQALHHVGVPSIAESAALLAVSAEFSGHDASNQRYLSEEQLALPLQRSSHATLAIAQARFPQDEQQASP